MITQHPPMNFVFMTHLKCDAFSCRRAEERWRQGVCVCVCVCLIDKKPITFHVYILDLNGAHRRRWCGPSPPAAPSRSCHCGPGTSHTAHAQSYRTALRTEHRDITQHRVCV